MIPLLLVTPTRNRPEAFALCERWVACQTYTGGFTWLVVDDGDVPAVCTMGQTVIRRQRTPRDPPHTLPANLLAAREHMRDAERVMVIEDDEFYGPRYVETMMRWLDTAPLVGEVGAKYYHIGRSAYKHFVAHTHASLCRTGFTREVLADFERCVDRCIATRTPTVDLLLWPMWKGPCLKFHDRRGDARLCVGIKGMPGLAGAGHDRSDYIPDPMHKTLSLWLGDDAELYRPFMGVKHANELKKVLDGASQRHELHGDVPDDAKDATFAGRQRSGPNGQAPRAAARAAAARVLPSLRPADLIAYTTIFGGYDKLKPARKAPGVRYVCFSDRPQPAMGWEIVNVGDTPDPVGRTRWHKMHPHVLFPEAPASLWLDASMRLRVNPQQIGATDAPFVVCRHHKRDCIMQEAEECVRLGRCAPADPVVEQARSYLTAGHPEHWGLYTGGLIYRRHTPEVRTFNETWWYEFEKWHKLGASRDQISLPHVLRITGIPFVAVDKDQRGRWVQLLPHRIIVPMRHAAERAERAIPKRRPYRNIPPV